MDASDSSTSPPNPSLSSSQSSSQPNSLPIIQTVPQRPRSWFWALLTLALLVGGGGGFLVWRSLTASSVAQTPQVPPGVTARLQTLETDTMQESSELIGNLEAEQGVVLRPKTTGRVTQIFVAEGASVAAGDPIVELSPERSQAEMSAAMASVSAARATEANSQAQLRAAEAEQVEAAANVELQSALFDRRSILVTEGALAQESLDIIRRDRDAAIAALNAAKEQVSAARAAVNQSTAAVAETEAQTAAIREDLADTLVVAPIAGVVGDMPIKLGDYVDVGDAMTSITENGSLNLELAIPIERRNQLRIGLPVELRFSDEATPIATGSISFVSPQVSLDTQSVLAKATFPNANARLQDAQRVSARIIWQQQPGVLVPTQAISRIGGQTFVFVVESEPNAEGTPQLTARQRSVRLGSIQGNAYQVLEGVEAGETIAVSGILGLSDGAIVVPE